MQPTAFHYSKHMKESDLLDENVSCTFCDSNDLEVICELQENPNVNLLKCKACELTLASRFPTDVALAEYYSKYYSSSDAKITNDNHKHFSKHIFSIIKKAKIESKGVLKIIDFGGGDGSISYEVAKRLIMSNVAHSVVVSIVDYENSIVDYKDSNIKINHIKDTSLLENDYDLVIASAVLEHIPKSKEILDNLISKLKPKGIVYIRTPYIVPLLLMLRKVNVNLDFTYPAHIYDMGELFWTKYCDSHGLKVHTNQPSPVETTFKNNLFRTVVAYSLKFPWKVFGSRYSYVGGWEVSFEVK